MDKLPIICVFTGLIHLIDTLSYSVRIAGVRTSRLALSFSLFNTMALASRTANMIQAPLTGSIVDAARRTHEYTHVLTQFRWITLSASIGTLLAIILLPTFVRLFSRAIMHLDKSGSLGGMLAATITAGSLGRARAHVRLPGPGLWWRFRVGGVSKRLLLLNALITGMYTIGVLACQYGSLLAPGRASTIVSSSGFVNGMAALLLTLLIDPRVALLTDKVLRRDKPIESVNKTVGVLVVSKFLGTLLAQALLLPAAYWLVWATRML